MKRILYYKMSFLGLILVFFSSGHSHAQTQTQAQGEDEICLSCEDIQHAANLGAIEKRLLEVSHNSLAMLDEEGLDWYAKFQDGGLLFDGWQEISEDVLAKIPDENKIFTKVTMLALGVKIGCEWSKENDIRKINTDMLQDWGKKIRTSVTESPETISVVISSIESEVNELLF